MAESHERLIRRLLELADEQNKLAVGASFEHRARCATDLQEAADTIARLREALEFYGKRKNWERIGDLLTLSLTDSGKRAREALGK